MPSPSSPNACDNPTYFDLRDSRGCTGGALTTLRTPSQQDEIFYPIAAESTKSRRLKKPRNPSTPDSRASQLHFGLFSEPDRSDLVTPAEALISLRDIARGVETVTGENTDRCSRKRRSFKEFLTNSLTRRRRPKKDISQGAEVMDEGDVDNLVELVRTSSIDKEYVNVSVDCAGQVSNLMDDPPPEPPERDQSSELKTEDLLTWQNILQPSIQQQSSTGENEPIYDVPRAIPRPVGPVVYERLTSLENEKMAYVSYIPMSPRVTQSSPKKTADSPCLLPFRRTCSDTSFGYIAADVVEARPFAKMSSSSSLLSFLIETTSMPQSRQEIIRDCETKEQPEKEKTTTVDAAAAAAPAAVDAKEANHIKELAELKGFTPGWLDAFSNSPSPAGMATYIANFGPSATLFEIYQAELIDLQKSFKRELISIREVEDRFEAWKGRPELSEARERRQEELAAMREEWLRLQRLSAVTSRKKSHVASLLRGLARRRNTADSSSGSSFVGGGSSSFSSVSDEPFPAGMTPEKRS